MKKIINALFLTIITLVTFSCSDVPSPYDITGGGNGGDNPAVEGDGTKDNPYSVAAAQFNQDGSEAWVKGYIVGIMGNKYKPDGVTFDGNIPVFTAPFDVATNVLIAASADETNIKNCLPVKVKGGSDLSVAINLKDHPDNLGKALIIKGKLAAGFGMASLIETTAAIFDGKEIGEAGENPDVPGSVTFLDEAFLTSKGDFTIKDVTLPEGSTYVWQWASYQTDPGYMKASGFVNNVNYAAESWLISPAVNLTKATKASLVFDHAYKFGVDKTKELTLWVTEAANENWAQITIPKYGTGADWTFVSSGAIDLASYVGKSIKFAFKYTSSTAGAATWEVKNVKIVGEGEKVDGPVDPNPPVEGTSIFTETLGTLVSKTTAFADFTGWDNSNLTFNITNAKIDVRAIAHKTDANRTETQKVNNLWFPKGADDEFIISNINVAGYKKFVLKYEAAANVFDAGATIDLNVLKVSFNGTDLVMPSKVVSKDNSDANVFFEMEIPINVAGTSSSTLKFTSVSSTNTMGLRLYNIRLIAEGQGGTDPAPGGGSDLFISEYVEGSGNNKYIEIYNPTSNTVDLSTYSLNINTNGVLSAVNELKWATPFAMSGTLEAGKTIIYKNSGTSLDGSIPGTPTLVVSSATNFNGNDPIGLFKNGELIDFFGVPASTVGPQAESFATDVTCRRKVSVTGPSKTYKADEWEILGKDDVSGLGSR